MNKMYKSHIRQMQDEDIDAICRVESQAFGNWWKQMTG